MNEFSPAIEAVLFAAGDSVPIARLSLILGLDESVVRQSLEELHNLYESEGRGFRVLFLDDKAQMCSAPEYAGIISKFMEQRKPPMLSQPALETLAVVAYFQPVTRAYIEQVRGVDSSYTVSMLVERGLIEESGRLEVPGRPVLFRTTAVCLRTLGGSALSGGPPLPEGSGGEGLDRRQAAIDGRSNPGPAPHEQISIGEITSEE